MNAFRIFYGAIAYVVGLAGLSAFVLFLGGFDFLPRHINSSAPGHWGLALAINIGLILLFGLQHSVMARPAFKDRWVKLVSPALERATYVLLSGLFMFAFAAFWQPISGTLWSVDADVARGVLWALYGSGFVILVAASFMISHFDLFGLAQIYRRIKNLPEPQPVFKDVFLYAIVRHPIQLGVLLCMWATPMMSATQFFLASSMTVYIFIGLYFEERDLIRSLGVHYINYKNRVRMVVPLPRRNREAAIALRGRYRKTVVMTAAASR